MDDKIINLDNTVFQICSEYPEAQEVMVHLGFTDIVKPGMLTTAGRIMTLRKGAKMKRIELADIRLAFEKAGFTFTGI